MDDQRLHLSDEQARGMPGGFGHRTIAFATVLLVALAAFTLGALLESSTYMFVVLMLASPVLIVMWMRNPNRGY